DEPRPAELLHVLAEDLAGLPVADVVVERTAGVGDLELAVLATGRTDLLAAADRAREIRRPRLRAGAVAAATTSGVPRARIEDEAATVEQDVAVAGRVHADGGLLCPGRGGCRGREHEAGEKGGEDEDAHEGLLSQSVGG